MDAVQLSLKTCRILRADTVSRSCCIPSATCAARIVPPPTPNARSGVGTRRRAMLPQSLSRSRAGLLNILKPLSAATLRCCNEQIKLTIINYVQTLKWQINMAGPTGNENKTET